MYVVSIGYMSEATCFFFKVTSHILLLLLLLVVVVVVVLLLVLVVVSVSVAMIYSI